MPTSTTDLIDICLSAVIRGDEEVSCPALDDPGQFADRVFFHGVQCLLMSHPSFLSRLPADVSQRIREEALGFTSWEMQGRGIVQSLLRALAETGIRSVLLKGTALAYSCYASPSERPKGDVDLLVSETDYERTGEVLKSLGFERFRGNETAKITQDTWSIGLPNAMCLDIDLHHNLLPYFSTSDVFRTESLLEMSEPVPALCPDARKMTDPLALLHACIHRAAHFRFFYRVGERSYYDGDRLIWLYDIHLLASRMNEGAWQTFLEASEEASGSARICQEALQSAHSRLGTSVPANVMEALAKAPAGGSIYDFYVRTSTSRRFWDELKSLPAGESKLGYLRTVFLPPESTLRQIYPHYANRSVPYLHFFRYKDRLKLLRQEWRQKNRSR